MATPSELISRVHSRRNLPKPDMRRALRRAAGASLADVADAIGVTRQAVSLWELGLREPRDVYVEDYLEILDGFRQMVWERDGA
jgi:DNA-binding XRE family transcriptional regulator